MQMYHVRASPLSFIPFLLQKLSFELIYTQLSNGFLEMRVIFTIEIGILLTIFLQLGPNFGRNLLTHLIINPQSLFGIVESLGLY